MGQFPQDLSIKEINMINLTQQRIGIYYKDRVWGKECFEYIVNQIPKEWIIRIIKSESEMCCTMVNGDIIRAIHVGNGARGYKFTSVIIQEGIDMDMLHNIVYPCVKAPIAVVRSVEDITLGYVAMKQELPHKKFVKIKVRY